MTVMIVTAVGLLFGAGSLLLFRFQCQMRIDRQHELEKVYAVRSALNFIRPYRREISPEGMSFKYHTGSERELGLFVKPVEPIFPIWTNACHFVMERGDFMIPAGLSEGSRGWYAPARDYECGWAGVTNLVMGSLIGANEHGLVFNDLNATNGVKWWVNIGMSGTGGWLQEDFGRRYWFNPQNYVGDEAAYTADVMRLYIIRETTNSLDGAGRPVADGRRHGWPLSRSDERAIMFEIAPMAGNDNARIMLAECRRGEGMGDGEVEIINSISESYCPSKCYMGIQLAHDIASFFYIKKDRLNDVSYDPASFGYTFSTNMLTLTKDTYRYFAEGIYTNMVDHKVHAPDLRAVFEVRAESSKRNSVLNESDMDALSYFKVTPAYQYDVFLEHPHAVTNRATIAQKFGTYKSANNGYAVLTYDTHGTENKGFRKDERYFERKGNR